MTIPRCLRRAAWVWAGLLVATSAAVPTESRLTPEEQTWLEANEPIVFVSQTSYPPFEFVDEEGHRQGMSIALVRWMSREMGFDAEFLDLSLQEAQEAVFQGRADVLTSLFRSEERERMFGFSDPTWEIPAQLFVMSDRNDVTRPADLQGKRVAMQRGDYAAEYLKNLGIGYEVVPVASFPEAVDRVLTGEADALIGDRPIVLYHLFSQGIASRIKPVGEPIYFGVTCMAVNQGRRELTGILNKGIDLARERGVFEALTIQWLGSRFGDAPPRRPRHTLALSAGLFSAMAVAIILLGWILHLRRIIAQRTIELREAEDARKPIARSRPWPVLLLRFLLFLGLLLPLGYATNHILYRYIIMPDYLVIEQKDALTKLNGCMDIIAREAELLAKNAVDWSSWDDTYEFVQDRNEVYLADNLNPQLLSDQTQIDVLMFRDTEGQMVWQGAFNPFKKQVMGLEDVKLDLASEGHLFFQHPDPSRARTGIWLTRIGPMLVATSPILHSNGDGPSRGTLIMGRFLRDEVLANLSSQMGVKVGMATPLSPKLTERQRELLSTLSPGATHLEETSPEVLTGYALMADFAERPALLFTLEFPRDIVGQGLATSRLLSLILLEFILVIMIGSSIWYAFSFREAFRRQAHVESLVEARTKALRESEEKWKSYVVSAPMGIFIADAFGRFLELNPAGCRMTGYGIQELFGRPLTDLLPREALSAGRAFYKQVLDLGQASGEFCLLHKSQERRWWSMSAVRLDGNRVLGFTEDITDRRRAEDSRELLQEQLNQAQKMESIGRLAGGVAHDFNNMLGVILGFTELGLDAVPPGEPLHDGLLEIRKAARRSADLTRQLLAFARKQTVIPVPLDLNKTIDGMVSMIRRLIGERIDLDWRPCVDAAWITIDPSQLDQLLVNLCVNARDAIHDVGRVSIETALVVFDEETCARHPGYVTGEYVRLAVGDNGCGMDEETIAHLFEPFFTTKAEGEGTGLGLATVYGIVKQNQGFIQVQSEPAKGSTFTLFFPRHGVRLGADAQKRDEARLAPPGHETILLVEDELSLLNMTRSMLERQGYTVLAASSPGEAIQLADKHAGRIHLLMTDVIMPDMNGRDLASRLLVRYPGLKCLFMSGYTAEVIAQHGVLEAGICFIPKPFTLPELMAKVREALA